MKIRTISFHFRKQKREASERCKTAKTNLFSFFENAKTFCFSFYVEARREAIDKAQRTDGESTVTGSSTPSAVSSSSISSVGQEVSNTNEHSLSNPTNLLVSANPSVSVGSCHSDDSNSEASSPIEMGQSPNYVQQALSLTTNNTRIPSNSNDFSHHSRKETFPINHLRQQQINNNNNNSNGTGSFLKI